MKKSLSASFDKQLLYAVKAAKKVIEQRTTTSQSDLTPQQLYDKLALLPMWCYDTTKHETNPDGYHLDFCCLTHAAGLPQHPATMKPMPLTPFQVDFIERVIKSVEKPEDMTKDDWLRLHHMFHILKGRQMGFTEIVLRIIQYFCFNRYEGKKIGIMAATNGSLASKDLRRFARLFNNFKSITKGKIKSRIFGLINDCEIEAYRASEEALTGDTKYACIYVDESAKWKLVDDTPVFNSFMPIVRTNGADLFLVSTFKGPIKMFYKIWKDPQEFIMFEYDIWYTEGNLYTKAQIENMLATSKEDPDQEYLCKPTIGRDSILGAVSDADRSDIVREWLDDEPEDEEDDSYVETEAQRKEWSDD